MMLPSLYDISLLFLGITITLLITSELVSSRYWKLVLIDREYLRVTSIFSTTVFMTLVAILVYQKISAL